MIIMLEIKEDSPGVAEEIMTTIIPEMVVVEEEEEEEPVEGAIITIITIAVHLHPDLPGTLTTMIEILTIEVMCVLICSLVGYELLLMAYYYKGMRWLFIVRFVLLFCVFPFKRKIVLNTAFFFIDRYPPPDRYATDRYAPPPDRYAPPPERDRYAAPTDRYRYPPSTDRYDTRASGGGSSDRYGYSREYDTRRDYDTSASYYSSGNGYSTSGYSSAGRGPMEKDPYGSGGGGVGGGYGGGGGGYGAGQNVEGSVSYPTGYSTATADQSSSYGHY